jgi:hypothetical protein
MGDYIDFSLKNLAAGATGEIFDQAFTDIVENIIDPNREAKKEREITVKVKFVPMDEERRTVKRIISISTKLVPLPQFNLESAMFVGIENGEYVGKEPNQFQQKLPFEDESIIDFKEAKKNARQ